MSSEKSSIFLFLFLPHFSKHRPLFKILCPSLKEIVTVVHSELGFCLFDQQGQDNKSLQTLGNNEMLNGSVQLPEEKNKNKEENFQDSIHFQILHSFKKGIHEDHV